MSIIEVQKQLKAPKGQRNTFGNYNFRSCEDIVEAVKPILFEFSYHLIMSDEMIAVGERVYVKAVATVLQGEKVVAQAAGWAREGENKKGFDDSQLTGSTSSYARKYALNGLFAIDDAKDADSVEHQNQNNNSPQAEPDKPWYNDFDKHQAKMQERVNGGESPKSIIDSLSENYKINKEVRAKILAIKPPH